MRTAAAFACGFGAGWLVRYGLMVARTRAYLRTPRGKQFLDALRRDD